MILATLTARDGQRVSGAEINVGEWAVSPQEFADFVDAAEVPEQIQVLGGTLPVDSDWRSEDPRVRAETFLWVADLYLDKLAGSGTPRKRVLDGGPERPEDDLPPEAVF
jgi:hypothetical protein